MIEMTGSETAYDVIEGVSAGAINAGLISTFEIGDEMRAVMWLETLLS